MYPSRTSTRTRTGRVVELASFIARDCSRLLCSLNMRGLATQASTSMSGPWQPVSEESRAVDKYKVCREQQVAKLMQQMHT